MWAALVRRGRFRPRQRPIRPFLVLRRITASAMAGSVRFLSLGKTFVCSFGSCGEPKVGVLTVTASDCLHVREFQRKWHSFLNAARRRLPCGIWTRERQPRSGNWHAHAVVDVGLDIKSG